MENKKVKIFIRGERMEVKNPVELMIPKYNILVKDTKMGEGVIIWSNVNIYGAQIGSNVKIGAFVEIRRGVIIGDKVKIEPYVFIPEGVMIGEGVFIGPGVIFTNDKYPRSCNEKGELITEYKITPTHVKKNASIGAGSVILCGVTVGENALVGAGSIVTKDVPPNAVVYGKGAEVKRFL